MKKYIVLLRGINVGGHRKIKMQFLRDVLNTPEIQNPETYIQSGNIVLSSPLSASALKKEIERIILFSCGFEVIVMAIPLDFLEKVFSDNPFLKNDADIEKLYCTFLEQPIQKTGLEPLEAIEAPMDKFIFEHGVLYFCYENGYGKATISNPVIERKLKVNATTRNWKTITRLIEMGNKI